MNDPGAALPTEGLASYAYLERRCEDECYRAARYRRPLTLLVVRLRAELEDEEKVARQLENWLRSSVRLSDLAAHLGERTYALLMPETDLNGARHLERRVRVAFPQTTTSVVAHPVDGRGLPELLSTADAILKRAA